MNDNEIDDAVRECVDQWLTSKGTYGTPTLEIVMSALVRKVRDAERERCYTQFIEERGVTTPCARCRGLGVRTYGSTATWRGGIGGQAMTTGVCDRCWGSGDEHHHWPSHRLFESAAKRTSREEKRGTSQAVYACSVCGVSITSKQFEDGGMCINCQMDDDAQAMEDRDRE